MVTGDWQRKDWWKCPHEHGGSTSISFQQCVKKGHKTQWLVDCLAALPPTFLFIRQRDILRAHQSFLTILIVHQLFHHDPEQLRHADVFMIHWFGPGQQITKCEGHKALDLRSVRVEWRVEQVILQAGGCDVWLAPALKAPDGLEGGHAPGLKGPYVILCICSLYQDPGRAMMFGHPLAVSSGNEDEIEVGQDISQNPTMHLIIIQIGSGSMSRSQRGTSFGIWTAYLGEVKVRAHTKVEFN